MAEAKVLSGAGLRGQIAGQTALCTVGKTGAGLTYRGYDVRDLAAECDFEEVAYLLFYGELPTTRNWPTTKAPEDHARPAAAAEGSARAHPGQRASDGCDAHRFVGARHP